MLTYTLWFGARSLITGGEYETITFDGREIGSVAYTDGYEKYHYRVYETAKGGIIVHCIEKREYNITSKIFEYSSIDEAKEDYELVLSDAGVI
jgi:hypothetical protein